MHNIMSNDKFFAHRTPAWHQLGTVVDIECNIFEANAYIHVPHIVERDVGYQTVDGQWIYLPQKALIAHDAVTHNEHVCCIKDATYHTLTHQDFMHIWHDATKGHAIETLGVLGHGEHMFVTVQLPSFDVKGDECTQYLMGWNPVTLVDAVTIRQTYVRVVCQNTLNMAVNAHSDRSTTVWHKSPPHEAVKTFIENTYAHYAETAQVIQEACTALANYTTTIPEQSIVLYKIYPNIPKPDVSADNDNGLDMLAHWEKEVKRQQEHHANVSLLFEHSPHNSQATHHTAWGLYNAVVEYEDHAKTYNSPKNRLWGASSQRKQCAFDACMALIA